MSELAVTGLLIGSLFLILGSGVWIGLTLTGVAWIAMELFSSRPAGEAMALTIWGSSSSWTLTALPLFIWMGEILFRTKLSESMFKGLAPWVNWLPGRLLHTNIIGCTIFAAVSGSSAATCATIGKMTLPELTRRGYPQDQIIGSLAGAGTLGLLIPPSIIMIVYGVSAEVSISQLFVGGILPGLVLASLFSGYIIFWSLRHPDQIPPTTETFTMSQRLYESRHLIPVVGLISAVLGSIYAGVATATEAAAVGVIGSFVLSAVQGSLSVQSSCPPGPHCPPWHVSPCVQMLASVQVAALAKWAQPIVALQLSSVHGRPSSQLINCPPQAPVAQESNLVQTLPSSQAPA